MKRIIISIFAFLLLALSVNASDEILIGTPVVDGVLDSAYLESYKIEIDGLEDEFYVSKGGAPEGSKGDKAAAYYLYDGSRLYCCVTVFDDAVFSRGRSWILRNIDALAWENDAVEMRVYYPELGEPIQANQYIFQCDSRAIATVDYLDMMTEDHIAAATVNGAGFIVEFSVPLSFDKKAGDEIGLSVEIDDLHERIVEANTPLGGHKFNAYGSQHPYKNMVKLGAKKAESNVKAFEDTKDHWGKADIDYVVDAGLFNGTDKGFEPNSSMTRAMFVTVLGRAYEMKAGSLSEYSSNVKFDDVEYGLWYGKYVDWAVNSGIADGTSISSFSPNSPISREDMAVMLFRFYFKFKIKASDYTQKAEFADADGISSHAIEAAGFCRETGIMMGDNNNNFRPDASATRAEVSAVIKRSMQALAAQVY